MYMCMREGSSTGDTKIAAGSVSVAAGFWSFEQRIIMTVPALNLLAIYQVSHYCAILTVCYLGYQRRIAQETVPAQETKACYYAHFSRQSTCELNVHGKRSQNECSVEKGMVPATKGSPEGRLGEKRHPLVLS